MVKVLEVVAAVIQHEAAYLCVQRGTHPHPYLSHKFEFPGGKTEPGETQPDAIIREIREELQMEIRPIRHLISVPHSYPDFSILLHAWLCESSSRELVLQEHTAARWLVARQLHALDWAAADVPVVAYLLDMNPARLNS